MDPHTSYKTWPIAMSDLRKALEPAADHPRAVVQHCTDCGTPFYRLKGHWRPVCADCKAARGAAANESMSSKSGPTYEKAVRKQLAYWTAEAKRLRLDE